MITFEIWSEAGFQDPRIPERFRNRFRITDSDCWEWRAGIDRYGYGYLKDRQKRHRAHRFFYERLIGPIPDGQVTDHLCHTRDMSCVGGTTCPHRRCINPAHLEPVSPLENTFRRRSKHA